MDALGNNPSDFINQLFDKIIGAIDGILTQLASGELIKTLFENIFKLIGTLLKDSIYETTANALKMSTFGAIDITGWFKNGNAEKVQKAIDKLSDRNKDLQQSLEDLNDTIKNTSGAKSVEAYKDSYSLQEEQNDNYKKIAQAQASYHGGHHSWDYYWNGFTEAQTEWIKKHVKENFNGDIWSLTPEEMKKLRGNVDIWDYIKNTGKGGYGERLTGKLDDYINQAGKLEELTDAINESLTQVSFSSMRNDFKIGRAHV